MNAATYEETRRPHQGGEGSLSGVGALFRQDPARRTLKYSIPIAVFVASLIRFVTGDLHEGDVALPVTSDMRNLFSLVVQLWILNLVGVIITHFNSRCSLLSMGLPISPRKLWTVRMLSVFGTGAIPVAVAAFIMAQGEPVFASPLDGGMLSLGARIISGLALAVVLYQLPSPGVYRIAGSWRYLLYVIAVSTGVLVYTVVTPQSWIFTAVPLVVSLAVTAGCFLTLPRGFSVDRPRTAPADRSSAHAGTPEVARETYTPSMTRPAIAALRLHGTVWWTVINTWPSWLMLVALTFYGWVLTYAYYHGLGESSELFMFVLWFWILTCQSIKRLHRLESLPVSRKVPFAHVVFTGVLVTMIGTGIYHLQYRLTSDPPTQVCYCNHTVTVSREFWEIAWDGKPPEAAAPWGESYTPPAYRPLIGRAVAVYNPFAHGEDNSPRFVLYQIDRAVSAIHGPEAVAAELTATTPLDSSVVADIEAGECRVAASAGRGSETRAKMAAVAVALLTVLFALVEIVWFRRYKAEAEIKQTRWFAILFFSAPHVVLITAAILEIKMIGEAWAMTLIPMILMRKAVEALPVSVGAMWLFALAVATASYFVVQSRYEKAEAPVPRAGRNLLSDY